jgi:ankyrin repeat protein
VLSACSTLIAIVEDKGSKIVQFSHFSVKEFLTSDRLRTSELENVRQYHIPLDAAHTTLAQVCFTVLLPSDEKMDIRRLKTFPLASYSARHWVDHAKFENVASQVKDSMERLFNPKKPHFEAWTQIYDVDDGYESHQAIPLYYAMLCGFAGLAKHLIVAHAEDVNAKCGHHGTPLHAASYRGHLDAVRFLLDQGAEVNSTNLHDKSPLCSAYDGGHLEVMRLLLEHGANVDAQNDLSYRISLSHKASYDDNVEVLHLLLRYNADPNTRDSTNATPLYEAALLGHVKAAQLLLDHGADVNSQHVSGHTPLNIASSRGYLETVQILLRHGADVHIRNNRSLTPFQTATSSRHAEVAQLLLEHGAKKE